MPTAYVLYIEDNIVGPCLHLIRSVCNPESSSSPHITVRYPIDRLQGNDLTAYQNACIDEIDIIEPGTFGLEDTKPVRNYTVFVKCNSDILETLSYKPHYPDSTFHITLYDGRSLEFAKQLLQVLQRFRWGFTVPLSKHTKLTQIEIGRHRRNNTSSVLVYPDKLKSLFHAITSERLSGTLLASLVDEQRLELTEAICAHLHSAAANLPKAASRAALAGGRGRTVPHFNQYKYSVGEQEFDSSAPELSKRLADDYEPFTTLYLTPPELAHDIVEYAVSKLSPHIRGAVDFGDPAIGTGVFFSTLLNVLTEDKISSAIGIEIDLERVDETRKRWSHRGLEVERGDYLHMDQLPPRTLILANPPYMRYQQVPPAYKQKLQERASAQMGMRISGQSSLYVYFLLLSHGWMKKEAVAAWLIPSEFMETNYGAVIRQYLTQRVELIRIHQFSPNKIQFENALVSSAVVVFRNCPPTPDQTVMLSSGGTLLNPEHTEDVTLSELRQESKWKVPWIRHRISSSPPPRIGDLFTVHRGLATGANSFFIMERSVAAQRGIPEVALRPLLPKARTLNTDVIEREKDGYPRVSPQLCLLDCGLPEEEIRTKFPRLLAYLETAPEAVLRSTLVRSRRPWYRQEQRQPSQFLCTYMGRGSKNCVPLRFLWNKSDAIATNTYLMLYPRKALDRLVTEQPDALERVFALLKEIRSEDLFINGRVYGGGLHKIEPKEFLNVRLSSFPSWLEAVVHEYLPLV
jgi:adenine-specific DNA-methyltransferase